MSVPVIVLVIVLPSAARTSRTVSFSFPSCTIDSFVRALIRLLVMVFCAPENDVYGYSFPSRLKRVVVDIDFPSALINSHF